MTIHWIEKLNKEQVPKTKREQEDPMTCQEGPLSRVAPVSIAKRVYALYTGVRVSESGNL